jgi:hypothetical protein
LVRIITKNTDEITMPIQNASITTQQVPDADKTYFSLDQANSALPYVSRIVDDITEVYSEIIELRRDAEKPNDSDTAAEKAYEVAMDRLSVLVDELHAVGVELKDFELGLVDFPALHDGRDILLCWKRGEAGIGHWHETDAGLAGRQPVACLEDEED